MKVMTKQELESRRKIVKKIAIALPLVGFAIPFIMGIKDNRTQEGAMMGVGGFIVGGILAAVVVVVALPSYEEQQKIKSNKI